MAMALHIRADDDCTCVAAGYESGHIAYYMNSSRKNVTKAQAKDSAQPQLFTTDWHCIYLARPHSQPVLSMVIAPDEQYLASSAADSVVATHIFLPIIESSRDAEQHVDGAHPVEDPYCILKTGNPGQQGLSINGTGVICASAGWDGIVRIYSWGKLKEREVLKWHRDGVYATAFAHALDQSSDVATAASAGSVTRRQGTLAARRERQAKLVPWLAVGGKDAKVSLWEIEP